MFPHVLPQVAADVKYDGLVKDVRRRRHKQVSLYNFVAVPVRGDVLQVLVGEFARDAHSGIITPLQPPPRRRIGDTRSLVRPTPVRSLPPPFTSQISLDIGPTPQ